MNASEARKELVAIAASKVGTLEKGGNNRGPEIVEFQKATWLDPAPWPWCAAYVDWVIKKWLENKEVVQFLGIENPEKWRPQTAGAWDFGTGWARKKGMLILKPDAHILPGDIIIFNFSGQGHIGFAEKEAEPSVSRIETIEGNTDADGSRDGGGVFRKKRGRSLIKEIVRIVA